MRKDTVTKNKRILEVIKNNSECSDASLAMRLGVTPSTIKKYRLKLGLEKQKEDSWDFSNAKTPDKYGMVFKRPRPRKSNKGRFAGSSVASS